MKLVEMVEYAGRTSLDVQCTSPLCSRLSVPDEYAQRTQSVGFSLLDFRFGPWFGLGEG